MIRVLRCERKSLRCVVAALASMAMTGCGGMSNGGVAAGPGASVQGVSLQGRVHGGQQPVSGATIQLYAAGSSGYGSGATALIAAGSYYLGGASGCVASGSQVCYANVLTDAGGNFTLTGNYSCPSPSSQVYLVATGGDPGGGANANLGIMAALGSCGQLPSVPFVSVNELTTVASVWALAPFMTGVTSVGTSPTNPLGLENAFAAVNKLVDVTTGSVTGPALPANATLPVAKINTLADILASCVNSQGGAAGDSSNCGNLFKATTVGTAVPTDTITAAMELAQHPGSSVGTLFGLASGTSPFQPVLATPGPNDWTIAVNYQGGGLATPKGIATDAAGAVWVANYGNSSVTKLSNTGAAVSGSGGYTAGSVNLPVGIAVDANGTAWVANGNSTVTSISSPGSVGTVYSGGGLSTPKALAADGSGNIWVANSGNSSVTEITASGSFANYTGAGVAGPVAIAVSPK